MRLQRGVHQGGTVEVIMSIQFWNNGIFDSMSCRFVEPMYLLISDKQLTDYLKKNPFPEDSVYSVQDLMMDMKTTGSWMLPKDIKEETGNFIAEMVQELI